MKNKPIKVLLRPEDFVNVAFCSNTDCAVSRAVKRELKEPFVIVAVNELYVCKTKKDYEKSVLCGLNTGTVKKTYRIKDSFDADDFYFIQDEYAKDPKMKKAEYYITLIEE